MQQAVNRSFLPSRKPCPFLDTCWFVFKNNPSFSLWHRLFPSGINPLSLGPQPHAPSLCKLSRRLNPFFSLHTLKGLSSLSPLPEDFSTHSFLPGQILHRLPLFLILDLHICITRHCSKESIWIFQNYTFRDYIDIVLRFRYLRISLLDSGLRV